MRTGIVPGAVLCIAGACVLAIATLSPPLRGSAAQKCAAAKTGHRKTSKPDPAAAWIGRAVRIDTVDHGLYVGTLEAVASDALILDIAVPSRVLRYSLPRAAVANLRPLDP